MQSEVDQLAAMFPAEGIHSVVINMEHKAFDQGLARSLAEKMQAPCYSLEELRGDTLYETVQREMHSPGTVATARPDL